MSKVAYRFLLGVTNNVGASTEPSGNSNRGSASPGFQGAWFKNLITSGARPSSSSAIENQEEDALRQNQLSDASSPLRQNSQSRHDI